MKKPRTSGLRGNAVIGQSGGPTCVINQSLVGVVREALRHSEIGRIYGAVHGIQGVLKQDLIDLKAESAATLDAVAKTPSAALGSVRKKPTPEECQAIFDVLRAHDVRYFFYIGGNDSAETASIINGISQTTGFDLRVCHVPKTIDNDLLVTDHCPGYGSAARFVALALQGDNLDNRALKGVKINVIMGRHAGFLTAAAGLGRRDKDDGPHLIYVPEVAFSLARFCEDVDTCMKKWNRCVVAVSEGIADEHHRPILTTGEKDSHGNVQLSGTGALGDFLVSQVKEKLGVSRVRADTFGYLQRSFPSVVSPQDAKEAREAAAFGVRCVTTGGQKSGSVAIRRLTKNRAYACEYFLTELANVAKNTRALDAAFISPSGNDVTPAFVKYALPLVGELPRTGRLRGKPVVKKPILQASALGGAQPKAPAIPEPAAKGAV
jgi:6-phosphofructokinase